MRVAAEPKETSPRRVLDEILRPHGLMVRETRGTLVVVRAPKQPARASVGAGTIRGNVVQARTGVALAAVQVQVQSSSQRAHSDDQGRFELAGVPAGKQVLLVSVVGYGLVRRDVVVAADAVVELTIPVAEGASTYVEEVTVTGQSIPGSRKRRAEPIGAGKPRPAGASRPAGRRSLACRADAPRRGDRRRLPGGVRGARPGAAASRLSIDGIDSPLLFHTVRGVEDGGSLALINSDVLESASIVVGARPQRLRCAPGIGGGPGHARRSGRSPSRPRDVEHDGGDDGVAGPMRNAPRGLWIVAARQSYLDWRVSRGSIRKPATPSASPTFSRSWRGGFPAASVASPGRSSGPVDAARARPAGPEHAGGRREPYAHRQPSVAMVSDALVACPPQQVYAVDALSTRIAVPVGAGP